MGRRRTSLKCVMTVLVFSLLATSVPQPALAQGSPSDLRGTTLDRDSRGDLVKTLQRILSALGYNPGPEDGIFGPATLQAVTRFQRDSGLYPDGIVGPRTVEALEKAWFRKQPPETYVVQPGDTLSKVCARFGLSLAEVVRLNNIRDPNVLYAGQKLRLRTGVVEQVPDGRGGPDGSNGSEADRSSNSPFPSPDKKICLTFDDGPDPQITPRILDILSLYNVPAVFFLVGKRAEACPDLVREIYDRGHTVGVHGYDHVPLVGMPYTKAREDLSRCLRVMESITGVRPSLWRPPAGAVCEYTHDLTRELGLTMVMWTNICGTDLKASGADGIVENVLKYARDGAIILLHESNPHVVEALPRLVEELARRGFGFQLIR